MNDQLNEAHRHTLTSLKVKKELGGMDIKIFQDLQWDQIIVGNEKSFQQDLTQLNERFSINPKVKNWLCTELKLGELLQPSPMKYMYLQVSV